MDKRRNFSFTKCSYCGKFTNHKMDGVCKWCGGRNKIIIIRSFSGFTNEGRDYTSP